MSRRSSRKGRRADPRRNPTRRWSLRLPPWFSSAEQVPREDAATPIPAIPIPRGISHHSPNAMLATSTPVGMRPSKQGPPARRAARPAFMHGGTFQTMLWWEKWSAHISAN